MAKEELQDKRINKLKILMNERQAVSFIGKNSESAIGFEPRPVGPCNH